MINKIDKPTLFIVDGNSYLHRAFHALPPLTNSTGFPTGAITGVLNMLLSIQERFKPDHFIVSFDAKGKTFRDDIIDDYKGTRPPTDPDLKKQFAPLKEVLNAWGVFNFEIQGVESDDTIATVAKLAASEGYQVYIGSGDKDINQVVDENIFMVSPEISSKVEAYGIEGVLERFGVKPNRICDFLTLTGDKVDNVKGVHGIGPTIAAAWLQEYGSLQAIIDNADKFKGKRGEFLREAIPHLAQSYELVTLKTDVDLGMSLADMTVEPDHDKLYQLTTLYGLSRFKKVLNIQNPNGEMLKQDIVFCDTPASLNSLKKQLSSEECYQWLVDVLHIDGQEQAHLIIAPNSADVVYVTSVYELSQFISELYYSDKLPSITSNSSKDFISALVRSEGLPPYPKVNVVDTRLIYSILNGGTSKLPTLDDINSRFVEMNFAPELDELRNKYKLGTKDAKWSKLSFEQAVAVKTEELMLAYKVSVKAMQSLRDGLEQTVNFEYELDKSMIPILATMEAHGVKIDKSKLEVFGDELDQRINNIISSITQKAGGVAINLNSPKQVSELLFDTLQIPSKKKSTSIGVLKSLVAEYPIVGEIIDYRSLAKLKSTNVDGLLSRIDDYGYVHPKFNLGLTTTGRLSSEDPNVQGTPVRSEDGKRIRDAFIAPEGFDVVTFDYSQIELRILASLSGDEALIAAFMAGTDVHKATSASIFLCDYDEVTSEQRRYGKAVNFGLIYGISANGLSRELNIDKKEAAAIINLFSQKHPKVIEYLDSQLSFAKDNLFVTTFNGRRINADGVKSSNSMIRSHSELAAKNAPIQGTAADLIKQATVNVISEMSHQSNDVRLVMQVHDELVFYINKAISYDVALVIQSIMENAIKFSVPLVVDIGSGNTWLEAH